MDDPDFNLADFLEYSSDSDEDYVEAIIKPRVSAVNTQIHKISRVQIKHKISYEGTREVIELINNIPDAAIRLPENKRSLQQISCDSSILQPIFLVFCKTCDELVESGGKCVGCGSTMLKNTKKNDFLVHFPILPQIFRILKMHSSEIMDYLHREHHDDIISDIDDGQLFKNLRNKYSNELLTFTLNTDGANVFSSTKCSLWPVQLYLNFLPPHLRYLSENIITTTLYYGEQKPDIDTLLFPLAKEFENIDGKSILVCFSDHEIVEFDMAILLIACDLPARAAVQNFIGHTGKFGCPCCYHPGVPIVNLSGKSTTIRYTKKNDIKLRSHAETIQLMQRALRECDKQKKSIEGIKGPSAVLMFPKLDIIKSFPIDYMHGIALGVMKDLIQIWIGKKSIPKPPYPNYMMRKTEHREIIDKRILRLKPPQRIRRMPRPLSEVANFKASELIHHMWFYLRYTLVGLLSTKIIKHFEKLSSATYILCKEHIKLDELNSACDKLAIFTSEFEDIYGPGAMTMNIHLLIHYREMVLNCGPLWSHSLFGFENNIGALKNYVCGKTDVLEQISKKYVASKADVVSEPSGSSIEMKISQEMEITIERKLIPAFEQVGIVLKEGDPFIKFQRLKIGTEVFTSKNELKRLKTCDYFVRLKNRKIGEILFYFQRSPNTNTPELLLRIFKEEKENEHWIEVEPTDCLEIYECTEIETKMMYFEGFQTKYITCMPNRYSRACC